MPLEHPSIADIRTDYQQAALDETTTGNNPIEFFQQWFDEAQNAHATEVNAMTLATVDENNCPHARIVLLKGIDEHGFLFYTNYESDKGKQMQAHPHVALVFFWKELERQVRIEGKVTQLSATESNQYFSSRPKGSQIGAWASPQSKVIADRAVIEQAEQEYQRKFADSLIPRPPHWGGYRVAPESIEFWQGRSSRLHDRILFSLKDGVWQKNRLAP